jgi:hypothetical protein
VENILNFVNEIKPFLEVLYFIAGIVVAIAAVFALKQISIMKKTLQVQSKRDALKITSEQCENYFSKIIELQDQFDRKVKEHDVKYFDGWEVTVQNDSVSVKHRSVPNAQGLEKVIKELDVLNSMESFASFFVSNVADEQVAYDTVGMTFVNFNRKLMPWTLSCREDGYFKNLSKLFVKWELRRLNEELQKEKIDLEKKLKQTAFQADVPLGSENT